MKHIFANVGSLFRPIFSPCAALVIGLLATLPKDCQADVTATYTLANLVNDSHLTVTGTLVVDTTTGETEAGSKIIGNATGGFANVSFNDPIAVGTQVFGGTSPYITGNFLVANGIGRFSGPGPVGDPQVITALANAGYQGGSVDAEWALPAPVADSCPSSVLALLSLTGISVMARRFKAGAA